MSKGDTCLDCRHLGGCPQKGRCENLCRACALDICVHKGTCKVLGCECGGR